MLVQVIFRLILKVSKIKVHFVVQKKGCDRKYSMDSSREVCFLSRPRGNTGFKVSKPNIQPSPPPPHSTGKKRRKHPSLYALFKHTYNAQILTKKMSDVIQPFMNSFFEKNLGLITQKTLFQASKNLFSSKNKPEKRFLGA